MQLFYTRRRKKVASDAADEGCATLEMRFM
jgi:hypothetical protein